MVVLSDIVVLRFLSIVLCALAGYMLGYMVGYDKGSENEKTAYHQLEKEMMDRLDDEDLP